VEGLIAAADGLSQGGWIWHKAEKTSAAGRVVWRRFKKAFSLQCAN